MKAKKDDKINCKDFPPSFEDDKTRMWDINKLGVDPKDMASDEMTEKNGTMTFNGDTEVIYETRVYPMFNMQPTQEERSKAERIAKLIDVGITNGMPNRLLSMLKQEFFNIIHLKDFDLKILSKLNKETNKITIILKGRTFVAKPPNEALTVEEYRAFINDLETAEVFNMLYDIQLVTVADQKYYDALVGAQIAKHKATKNQGKQE
jgi:hypothetical protein